MTHVPNLIFIFSFLISAFLLSLSLTPWFIKFLHKKQFIDQVKEGTIDGKTLPIFQKFKGNRQVPKMGGVLIWGTVFVITLLSVFTPWSILDRGQVRLPLFTITSMGLIGALDDWFNIKGIGKHKGLSSKSKFVWILLFAIIGSRWFYFKLGYSKLHIPSLGSFDIFYFYVPLFIITILFTEIAVDWTDGLDGLAGGLLIMAFSGFGVLAYAQGLIYLTVFCALIVGALISFLWFNILPASFIMGNTGSLSLGATLGVIAMLTNSSIVLIVIGLVFFLDGGSSIVQLLSKKFLKRKIFPAAPVHFSFLYWGWTEGQVVMRFWIIGAFFTVIGIIIGLIGMG